MEKTGEITDVPTLRVGGLSKGDLNQDSLHNSGGSVHPAALTDVPFPTPEKLQITPFRDWNIVSDGTIQLAFPPPKYTQFWFEFKKKDGASKWMMRVFPNLKEAFEFVKCNYSRMNAFFKTSYFFNPTHTGRKRFNKGKGNNNGRYEYANNLFFKAISVLDFDLVNLTNEEKLDVVKKHSDYLREKYHATDLLYVRTSRGWHVDWLSWWEDFAEAELERIWGKAIKPVKRKDGTVAEMRFLDYPGNKENCVLILRKRIIRKMRDDGLNYLKHFKKGKKEWDKIQVLFDAPVFRDTRRIVRLPGSYHVGGKITCEFFINHLPTKDAERNSEVAHHVQDGNGKEIPAHEPSMTEISEAKAVGKSPIGPGLEGLACQSNDPPLELPPAHSILEAARNG